jgi:hypothetical protein
MKRYKMLVGILLGASMLGLGSLASPADAKNDMSRALNELAVQQYAQNMAIQQQLVAQQIAAEQQKMAAMQSSQWAASQNWWSGTTPYSQRVVPNWNQRRHYRHYNDYFRY